VRFKKGELLMTKEHYFGTTVWDEDLNNAVDSINGRGFVIVISCENDSGWTQVATQNGIIGFVHRNNLNRIVQR